MKYVEVNEQGEEVEEEEEQEEKEERMSCVRGWFIAAN